MMSSTKADKFSGTVVGDTPEIHRIYRAITESSLKTSPVLIIGENGTGKETIGRAIHAAGTSYVAPFRIRVCAHLRAIDLNRELSGDSGLRDSPASRGTLFLDQIIDLPLDLQAILLRALEQSEWDGEISTGLRIIAANTTDVLEAVKAGRFRADLYFRLNALTLYLPPLRERKLDVPLLAHSLLEELSRTSMCEYELSDGAMLALLNYTWPGNVHELMECLLTACRSSGSGVISVQDLPLKLGGNNREEMAPRSRQVLSLFELERKTIEDTLRMVSGHRVKAARLLGIGKSTLYRKLRDYAVS